MFKFFIPVLLIISSCSTIVYQDKSVKDITELTKRNVHSWALTSFKVKWTSAGEYRKTNGDLSSEKGNWFRSEDRGSWYISSSNNYRSANGINVRISQAVVEEFKQHFNLTKIDELNGRHIKVKGLIRPQEYCLHAGCPTLNAVRKQPQMYVQSELVIEDIADITLL
jgi:hypothetical protein